jgi:AraC-like DNA-binding protein
VHKGLIGENAKTASTGSLIVSHPFEIHNNTLINETRYSFITFYISNEVFRSLVPSRSYVSFPGKVIDDPHLYSGFFKVAESIPKNHNEIVDSLFETQLVRLIRHLILKHSNCEPFECNDVKNTSISPVKDFILENIGQSIKLDSLAAIASMDRYKFLRWFKREVGLTPMDYVILQRVERGKKMLKNGKPSVHAALDSGFYDQSHFSKYFKHFTGITPGEYQQQCNILQDFVK